MELNNVDIWMELAKDRFKFASIMWRKDDLESGYLNIGVPFQSSNSEVLHAAYSMSIFVNNFQLIYDSLMLEEIIQTSIINFYELGGKIEINSKGAPHTQKLSELLNEENLEKVLYCIFLLHKFNRPDIFYIKQMERALEYFPAPDVDAVIAKVIYGLFERLKVLPYIIKEIPIPKDKINNIQEIREVSIWDLYQNYRAIMVTDKISLLEGIFTFEEEYFDAYLIFNSGPDFFVKPDMQDASTGYVLVMVFRKMGNSALICRPKINTNNKFRTLLFLVASRLLTLNQIFFLHGDLHCGNFVLELDANHWYSDYIQCEDIFIRNTIDLYNSFDLIDFGSCIEFHEGLPLCEFIQKIVPNLFSNYEDTIRRLAKSSPVDLAIASTLLDLYRFIESFYNSSHEYEQIRRTKEEFQEYIITQFTDYLDANTQRVAQFEGGAQSTSKSVTCKSILQDEVDNNMFVGGDINPNYGNIKKHNNLTARVLPLYKLIDHFFREESDLLDKNKIVNTIQ
jgi:hypothetical protein